MAEDRPPIKTSASGRVPQWVMDEALGKKVEPVPFRGPTSTSAQAPTKARRRRGGKVLLAVVLAGAAVAGVTYSGGLDQGPQLTSTGREGSPTSPRAGTDLKKERLLAAPKAPTEAEGARYRFSQHQPQSKDPVAWDPCRPIRYVVRPDNAPPGGQQLITDAFAALSAATGLKVLDDGSTREGPVEDRDAYQPDTYGERWAPVLVTWATTTEVPDFGVDVAGEAGPSTMRTSSGDEAYVSGIVQLSAEQFRGYAISGRQAVARQIVLHELGHLVGLAHSPDRAQTMFPRAGSRSTGYGAGDLAGLAALGRGACQPDA